jgi:E3 ubiquitin-protein ligase NEDD4
MTMITPHQQEPDQNNAKTPPTSQIDITAPTSPEAVLNPSQQMGYFSTNTDQFGSLPENWECFTDPLGRPYYFHQITRRTSWTRPSDDRAVINHAEDDAAQDQRPLPQTNDKPPMVGRSLSATSSVAINTHNTTTTGNGGPLPVGWEVRYSREGRPYHVDHNRRTTAWVHPRGHSVMVSQSQDTALQPQKNLPVVPSPSEQENLFTPTDDPWPQYRHGFRNKLIYFRSQPAMRRQPGSCHITVRKRHLLEDSYTEIMRQTSGDLKKKLMITFDGESSLDYDDSSRYIPSLWSRVSWLILTQRVLLYALARDV